MTPRYPQSAPARTEDEVRTLNGIDSRVHAAAMALGAHEMQYSSLVARGVLDRAEYPQAFPHLLMSACSTSDRVGGDTGQWFFLAMGHWRLDQKAEARKWYDRAVAWMDKNQEALKKESHNWEVISRFRAEAAELLEIKKK